MQKDIEDIKVDIAEIKTDLKYHIKRTDMLEEMVRPAYQMSLFIKIGASVAVTIAAIAAVIMKL